jgi:hypothetical protein
MPPTKNFVNDIYIQDGFSIPIPILQLVLNDTNGSLSADLNIQDGTKITVRLGRSRDSVKTRTFRVFSFRKETTADGPHLVVTAIFDAPKWESGVFTECFEGNSSSAMGEAVGKAGLQYDGPKGSTDDKMKWLNVNLTRSSFTEDMASRGYKSEQSAMYRLLTMNGKVRYKDLFQILQESPKFTYLMNTSANSASGKPVVVRETQDGSSAGFSTNWNNYGKKQYNHSLDKKGQTSIEKLNAPVMGDGLPINDEVKGMVQERGAQVMYTGFDPGTDPKPESNVHKKYEQAIYQNLRYYALFSERLTVLTDMYTEAETFDCGEYKHSDQIGTEFVSSRSMGGKWLIGGITLWIHGGHKYSEIHYLYRPFIREGGQGGASGGGGGGGAPRAGGQVLPSMPSNPAPARRASNAISSTPATLQSPMSGIQSATKALKSLTDFNSVVPSIPTQPLSQQVPAQQLDVQKQLKDAVASMKANPQLKDIIDIADGGMDIQGNNERTTATLKKFAADDVTKMVQDFEKDGYGSIVAESLGVERVSVNGDAIALPLKNAVAKPMKDAVGDVGQGGVWVEDLIANGIDPDTVEKEGMKMVESHVPGASFLMSNDTLNYSTANPLLNPKKTAENLRKWAKETTPESFLSSNGITAYREAFGEATGDEITAQLKEIEALSQQVEDLYELNEMLLDYGEDVKEVKLEFNDPNVAPVIDFVIMSISKGMYQELITQKSPVSWDFFFSTGKETMEDPWTFPFTFPSEVTTSDVSAALITTAISRKLADWMDSK